jgi:hypothetical protein
LKFPLFTTSVSNFLSTYLLSHTPFYDPISTIFVQFVRHISSASLKSHFGLQHEVACQFRTVG